MRRGIGGVLGADTAKFEPLGGEGAPDPMAINTCNVPAKAKPESRLPTGRETLALRTHGGQSGRDSSNGRADFFFSFFFPHWAERGPWVILLNS